MIDSRDDIIWLSFPGWTQKVPLAFVIAVVVWVPQIAILTPWEPLPHLLLLFGPIVHHITKARNGLWPVPPKISVDAWVGDAVVEAVDDVALQNVRDGGTDVEEAMCVRPQELVTFLLTLGKIVMSTCTSDRSLEVVDEDLLEALPGVDGVAAEALQPGERRKVQSHQKVDDFGDVRAPCNLNGCGVATEPLLRSLLAVVLGDADRLEALRVLIAAKSHRESRKTITAISPFSLDPFTYLTPGGDHRPRIAAFINVLAQVFCRRPMIGLSRVTLQRWLLPPARGLAPVSVVVVVARLKSRTTASRSAVSLSSTLTHALLPDGGNWILLIQLDPGPLLVKECLVNVWIVAVLEDGRDLGNVSHRGPETPFTYSDKLRVKLAIHRSPTLVGPPSPDRAGPVPGPPRLAIGVILFASVGSGLILRDRFEVDDGKTTIVLAFFRH
jgi:hypothetical protein